MDPFPVNSKLKNLLNWLLDRLSETSTWRGIFQMMAAAGIYNISDNNAAKVTAAGLGVVGVINIFREGSPTKTQVKEALSTKTDNPNVS